MSEFALNQNARDFFVYSYFGFASEDIIIKCAKRAYRDLNRTLVFKDGVNEDQREGFCNDICKEIKGHIADLFATKRQEEFDEKHKAICCDIIKKRATESGLLLQIKHRKSEHERKEECFYYGQAQKWLNMTLKYMWLIGLWKEQFKNILSFLHVPVDSFIIEDVWHEGQLENDKEQLGDKEFNALSIEVPCANKNREYRKLKYNQDRAVPWSKWTYDEYIKFQKDLRESPVCGGKPPIEWEGPAWIEIAKKRSMTKQRKGETK